MKKIVLLLTALFATGTILMAQGGPRGGQRNMDPKDRAERMTERMVKEYSLNDAQKKELYALNLDMAQKMTPPGKAESNKEAKRDNKKNAKVKGKACCENCANCDSCKVAPKDKKGKHARHGEMKQSRDDYDAKVKKIFTKEQYEAYTKNQAERQKRMGERGNRPQRANS